MMRRSEKRYAFIQSELNDSVMKSGVFHQMSEKFSRSTDVFTTANGGGGVVPRKLHLQLDRHEDLVRCRLIARR